jgi:adenylate cyclase
MAEDEPSTFAALQSAREIFRNAVNSRNGRIVDMAGDSVLAIFETAIGAVGAALEVQEALGRSDSAAPAERPIPFRIGLHLADVFELPDGSVYGDGVNVAARLQAIAEPGGIVVSEVAHVAMKGKLAVEVHDAGEHRVKNIPHPLRVFKLVSVNPAGSLREPASYTPLTVKTSDQLPLPDKPSVAVLAFANMSGDAEQDYFTDGISEGIVTGLSQFHELFVIAHHSSFSYKGSQTDARTVAKELGVRYVVEGSIRKASHRIRVTAQLIDASSGIRVWAERYDRALEDVFDIQDELTEDIVRKIAPNVLDAESQRVLRRHPESLRGYEVALQAYAKAMRAHVKGEPALVKEAVADARAALTIDPSSTTALAALAFGQWQLVYLREGEESRQAWLDGIAAADRLIEIDRHSSQGYVHKGLLQANAQLLARGSDQDLIGEALANLRRACELNPHNSQNLIGLCYGENMAGNVRRSIAHAQEALRLSPRDPLRYVIYHNLASASFSLDDYAGASAYAVLGLADAPNFLMLWIELMKSQVALGDVDRARASFAEAQRRWPKYFAAPPGSRPAVIRNPWYQRKSLVAMRVAAGLEELSAFEALVPTPSEQLSLES